METAQKTRLDIISSGRPLGAEIRGVDLSQDLDDETARGIREALDRFGVVFLRRQNLAPERHVAFTARFGSPEKHILHKQYGLPGYPEILLIGNVKEGDRYAGVNDGGLRWHTDLSYKKEPTMYSFLYALEVPHTDGEPRGDTLFASTSFAYETLPEDLKKRIQGKKGIHRYGDQYRERIERKRKLGEMGEREELTPEQIASVPDVVHPIVRTHPVTGKKCLYVNEWFTVGIADMPEQEAKALLKELCEHCTREQYTYRHKWGVGDLLVWDNVQTQHLATFDFEPTQRRLLRRTIVQGAQPF